MNQVGKGDVKHKFDKKDLFTVSYDFQLYFQIAAKINQPGAGGGDGSQPLKRPFESDGNSYGMFHIFSGFPQGICG